MSTIAAINPAARANTFTTGLRYSKETKGTFVFKNDDEDAPITSLYIGKHAFPEGAPGSITVTVQREG